MPRTSASKKQPKPVEVEQGNPTFMGEHSFYWQSRLSEERKQQIRDFVNSLTSDQQRMIMELRSDAAEETRFDIEESSY